MLLTCEHCGARYRTRLESIPARGVKATCQRCNQSFVAYPDTPEATPMRKVAWVFSGDPATDSVVQGECLAMLEEHFTLRILRDVDRVRAVAAMERGDMAPPDTLIFGDMHVILEEPLLEVLGAWSRCEKVLVSTHHNEEMLENAKAFTGVDLHLTPPFDNRIIVRRIHALAA